MLGLPDSPIHSHSLTSLHSTHKKKRPAVLLSSFLSLAQSPVSIFDHLCLACSIVSFLDLFSLKLCFNQIIRFTHLHRLIVPSSPVDLPLSSPIFILFGTLR